MNLLLFYLCDVLLHIYLCANGAMWHCVLYLLNELCTGFSNKMP